jgi:hypothetical protein
MPHAWVMIKTRTQRSTRVTNLLLEIEAGQLDGKRFSEQLLTMQPDEQAHLVAGLLSAYKAVCEPLENVQ